MQSTFCSIIGFEDCSMLQYGDWLEQNTDANNKMIYRRKYSKLINSGYL